MKILVVEDDKSLRQIIREALEGEGMVVETAPTYAKAVLKVEDYTYDCVLLDIMLPDGSGMDLLDHIKQIGKGENVIIISAKDSLDDKVSGLDKGADDYLAKPFHIAELIARVRSVVRRKEHKGEMSLTLGNVELRPERAWAAVAGQALELNRKEFDILAYFMARPGHLVDKQMLAEAVWGDHIDQVDNFDFLYAQMKNLRRKMKDAGADVEIKAVYGIGYKMIKL